MVGRTGKKELFIAILFCFALLAEVSAADLEKVQIIKTSGRELLVDRYEKEGNFIVAWVDNSKIIIPQNEVRTIQKVKVQPKVLVTSGKTKKVVFEKPENFTGTVAHYQLYCEREKVDPATYEKARGNLDEVLQQAFYPLQQIAWKSSWEFNDAVTFARTIDDILKKNGFEYEMMDLLAKGLLKKRIDCDLYAMIYFSAAETAKFPPGVISFVTILPQKGHSLKVLKGGTYVPVPTKDVGHAYLKFRLSDGQNCIVEATTGNVYPQPVFVGDSMKEANLSELQNEMKANLVDELSKKAHKLLLEKKIDDAIRILESASAMNLKHKELLVYAYLSKCQECMRNKEKAPAEKWFFMAQKVLPKDPNVLMVEKYFLQTTGK